MGELPLAERGIVIATMMRPEGNTGVQTHARHLLEGFSRASIPCTLVTPFSAGRHWYAAFAARPLFLQHLNHNWSTRWYRHWHFLALRKALLQQLSRSRAAVVVAQCPLAARATLEVREQLGLDVTVALVCHFNYSQASEFREKGELTDEATSRRILQLEEEIAEEVDLMIYVSNWIRQVMEGMRGVRPASSAIIWNGLPTTVYDVGASRIDLGLDQEDLVLVNVGSLEPRKNQMGLVEFFAVLAVEYPRAHLLLIGDGPQRAEIGRKVEQLHLTNRVHLLGACSNVPSLLRIADIYVHYAKAETFGIVLIEAARAGLPIAALPVGGIPEVFAGLGGGVELNADSSAPSMERLRPYLESEQLRRDVGSKMRSNFLKNFSVEAMIESYLRAIEQLV
jgi:glycosyltransferase involved in cell wall biosynthesis